MLNAAIKDSPVFGGKVKSFEADKVKGMPGVKHVLPVGDSAVAVVADTWWEAKTALDALPIVWDEGPNAQVSSATIAEMLKQGLDAPQAFVRNQNGDAKADAGRRGEEGRGRLRLSVPEPRADGADERDGQVHGRSLRGLGPHAERRGRIRRHAGGLRAAGGQVRGLQDQPRRRLRPARRVPRLRHAGRPDRQADPGHAGEASVDARRGHDPRPISPGHAGQDDGRAGRRAATSPPCTCACRASRSSPPSSRRTCRMGATTSPSRASTRPATSRSATACPIC